MRTLIALLLSTLPLLASPNTMQGVQFCPLRLNAKENLENLLLWSEDLTQASWLAQNGAAKVNATEFTVDGITLYSGVYQNVSVLASTSYVLTVQAKAAAPRSLHLLYYDAGVGVVESANLVIGVSWTDVSFSFTTGSGASAFVLICDSVPGVAGAIDVQNAQLRRISSSATYVKTTAVPYTTPDGTSVQAWYDPNSPLNTLNGAGMSQLKNLAPDALENWLLWSEDFSNGAEWSVNRVNAFGATDTGATGAGSFANTSRTTDPLGGNTADFLQEDSSAAIDHFEAGTINAAVSGGVTLSFYVKAGGRNYCAAALYSPDTLYAFFDLSAIAVTDGGAIGAWSNYSATIEDVGNGWRKCTLNGSLTGTVLTTSIFIVEAANTKNYNGDNTSGLFLWGAQLRRATKSPTYVKTEAIRYVVEDRDLNQSTGASQPLLSRADNKGNLLTYSDFTGVWDKSIGVTATPGVADVLGGTTGVSLGLGGTGLQAYFQTGNWPGLANVSVYVKGSVGEQVYFYYGGGGETPEFTNTFTGGWQLITVSVTQSDGIKYFFFDTAHRNGGPHLPAVTFDACFPSLRQSSWSSDYIATTSTPVYPGQNGSRVLVFDGSDDYMKTATFPLVQPETVVGVFDATSMTSSAFDVFDGFSNSESGTLYVFNDPPPSAKLYAGAFSADQALVLGTNYVFVSVFNSASSALTLNSNTVGGDSGTQSMNGFTVGRRADGSQYFCGNIADLLILNRVLTSAEQSYLVQGLARKAGVNVW